MARRSHGQADPSRDEHYRLRRPGEARRRRGSASARTWARRSRPGSSMTMTNSRTACVCRMKHATAWRPGNSRPPLTIRQDTSGQSADGDNRATSIARSRLPGVCSSAACRGVVTDDGRYPVLRAPHGFLCSGRRRRLHPGAHFAPSGTTRRAGLRARGRPHAIAVRLRRQCGRSPRAAPATRRELPRNPPSPLQPTITASAPCRPARLRF